MNTKKLYKVFINNGKNSIYYVVASSMDSAVSIVESVQLRRYPSKDPLHRVDKVEIIADDVYSCPPEFGARLLLEGETYRA